jgi:hypothetical protein
MPRKQRAVETRRRRSWRDVGSVGVLTALLLGAAVGGVWSEAQASDPAPSPAHGDAPAETPTPSDHEIVVNVRLGLLDAWPCMRCHDKVEPSAPDEKPDPEHREVVIDHASNMDFCGQCHDLEDMNSLRLITGEQVELSTPHVLCGQCHGEQKASWDIGVHGKQVGEFAGTATRYTCTDCHDAHAPAIPTMRAEPPPPFPRLGIPKDHGHE